MADTTVSVLDGSLLLPSEQMIPSNIGAYQSFLPSINTIGAYMATVQNALYNYEAGYTSKIVLNPADLQTNIALIHTVTVNMAGGYDVDGVTKINAQAVNILPDLLMTLRDQQLQLCQLYGIYVDTQGQLVGPLDTVQIENTSTTVGGVTV